MIGTNHIVEITGYSAGGAGVARLKDGCVVFVREAVRGDVCRINITKTRKNSCDAEIAALLEPSIYRIKPDCPVFGICGGCAWRHVSYTEELYAKRERVKDALERIGGFSIALEDEVLTTGKILNYRNKALFPVALKKGEAVAGFYQLGSHEVIGIDDCLLVNADANAARRCVCDWITRYGVSVYDKKTRSGLIRHIYTRTGASGLTVCIVINGAAIPRCDLRSHVVRTQESRVRIKPGTPMIPTGHGKKPAKTTDVLSIIPYCDELLYSLRETCVNLNGLLLNVNDGNNSVVLGERFVTLWGEGHIDENLGDLTFRMSPESFFQVNTEGTVLLYDKAKEYAALNCDDVLLDLYCGIGAITLYLGREAKRALGVEVLASAVDNARENANQNNIRNAEFVCSDASQFYKPDMQPGCVVIDPPRKGLSLETIENILRMSPPRVIYISCEPSTLARDLKLFHGYELRKACVVDMFPRTTSVECLVQLEQS